MALRDPFANVSTVQQTQAATYDAGLRAYMLRIYNYMASALALTGITALITANTPSLLMAFYNVQDAQIVGMSALGWLVALAPLGMVLWMSFGVHRMSAATAQMVFWAFSVVMGLSLASVFLLFTGESIARAFFITAGTFGAMSLWGYTTKKDLTAMGSFLMMGLFGLILASLVNIFLQSSGLMFVTSVLGVVIFTGLTAWDTQRLKNMYYQLSGTGELMAKMAIMGALSLYLDFINMFLYMLRFFGDRR